MPLNSYLCKSCNKELRTFKKEPNCCGILMSCQVIPPSVGFFEPTLKEKGKSRMKDMDKIAKKRAKDHSRVTLLDSLIQNNRPQAAKVFGWVNDNGKKRESIDDL